MVKGNASMVSEIDLIRRLRQWASSSKHAELVLGIGDDCAIYRPRAGEELLFTTDLLVEDVHFRRAKLAPGDIGWRCLARGLSDIAAMGGEPRFCLVSLALAPWVNDGWVTKFYRGLLRLALRERVALAGGDLGRSARLTCDIVVCGAAPKGLALRRDTARAGDAIYVSGALGQPASSNWTRPGRPQPRLALGQFLRGKATAAMDLSDGLSLDLKRLCEASGLEAEITAPPIFRGATLAQALHGGEDYELLFTAPPFAHLPQKHQTIRLTKIGTMREGKPGLVRLNSEPLPPLGWDHFKPRS